MSRAILPFLKMFARQPSCQLLLALCCWGLQHAVTLLATPGASPVVPNAQGLWTGEYTLVACDDRGAEGFCGGFVPI
jgi:hypothetical protein